MFYFFKIKKIRSGLCDVLTKQAPSFNGLYNGIDRVLRGENKKNFKSLDEFYKRVSLLPGYEKLYAVLNDSFSPSKLTPKKLDQLKKLVFFAFEQAGIDHSKKDDILTIDQNQFKKYQEWDGKELYIGCRVVVISPEWHQGDHLLEKGFCSVIDDSQAH